MESTFLNPVYFQAGVGGLKRRSMLRVARRGLCCRRVVIARVVVEFFISVFRGSHLCTGGSAARAPHHSRAHQRRWPRELLCHQ